MILLQVGQGGMVEQVAEVLLLPACVSREALRSEPSRECRVSLGIVLGVLGRSWCACQCSVKKVLELSVSR